MSNVVSLFKYKRDVVYEQYIARLDKQELLQEMVQFQEDRSRVGHLTPFMIIRGIVLFRALENMAETHALQSLTKSYRKHLECELKNISEPNKDSW